MSKLTVASLRTLALAKLNGLRSFALLLGRLSVGLEFVSSGWGKVHSIPKVTEYFASLHIPVPGFNAVLVGYSQLFCGAALIIGLLTRLATIPIIISMIVAILTAKIDKLHSVVDLVGFDEFLYIVILVMIAILGPGKIALDSLLARRFEGRSSGAGTP